MGEPDIFGITTIRTKLVLVIILLTSCTHLSPDSFPFVYDDNCSQLCWLGIDPGMTTYGEVNQIVNSSRAFDKENTHFFENRILTIWSPGRSKSFPCGVRIWFEGELVRSISFHGTPYTVQEFIDLIGEPDEISISLVLASDAKFLQYFVYFASSKTLIEVYPSFQDTGPGPRDRVFELHLNSDFSEKILPEGSSIIQPWLGYRNLDEYLPSVKVP